MSDKSNSNLPELFSETQLTALQEVAKSLTIGNAYAKTIANQLSPLYCQIGQVVAEWNERVKPVASQLGETLLKTINSESFKRFSETIVAVGKAYAEINERLPNLTNRLAALAERGWFISYNLGLGGFTHLASIAEQATDEELDMAVQAVYAESIQQLAEDICTEFPARKFAIAPAVTAHLEGNFALSVPMFFIQADGICTDKTELNFFMRHQDKKHLFSKIKEMIDEIRASGTEREMESALDLLEIEMLNPVSDRQPIGYDATQRKANGYTGLNRNTVIHGEALEEYATEINSLKAFSFMCCIAALPVSKDA